MLYLVLLFAQFETVMKTAETIVGVKAVEAGSVARYADSEPTFEDRVPLRHHSEVADDLNQQRLNNEYRTVYRQQQPTGETLRINWVRLDKKRCCGCACCQ